MSHPRAFAVLPILTVGALTVLSALPAQDSPGRPMVNMRATGLPQLLAALPETRLGRLLADPDVAPAAEKLMDWTRRQRERSHAVLMRAVELGVEVEPYVLANLLSAPDMGRIFERPFEEQQSFEVLAILAADEAQMPLTLIRHACLPQFEGRWTMAFESEAKTWAESPWFDADFDAKIGGNRALALTLKGLDQPRDFPFTGPEGFWMQHLPGRFLQGSGSIEEAEVMSLPPIDEEPRFALTLDLKQYLRMFDRLGMGMPQEFRQLGFSELETLEWRVGLAGEELLDEIEVRLSGKPTGLIGVLLNADAPPPPQALPDGALVQVRSAIDLDLLLDTIRELVGDEFEMSAEDQDALVGSLTGGVAFGVTAPAGSLFPRICLSLGVANEETLREVLSSAVAPLPTKAVTYEDVPCTLFTFDGMPQGIQPAFCLKDGVLHVAESGRSLRALLKAQASGETAMDVGDAPVAAPGDAGSSLPHFDLRWDTAAIYRAFHETWLPLYVMSVNAGGDAALEHGGMPPVDVVEDYCGKARGVLRRDGDRYTLQCLGTLGGPHLAALAMAWGPMMTANASDYSTQQMEQAIARHLLAEAWLELEAFREREQRWPTGLAELFEAGKLADDALSMPGDGFAEEVELAGGRTIRTSFRYFPEPVKVEGANHGHQDAGMLLIEIRPREWNRAMLDTEGRLPELYGGDSQKPIDEFGK